MFMVDFFKSRSWKCLFLFGIFNPPSGCEEGIPYLGLLSELPIRQDEFVYADTNKISWLSVCPWFFWGLFRHASKGGK